MNLQPVKLTPALKDYLWGGTKLKTEYHKQSDLETVAESWELSTHQDGQSVIASGAYAGRTLEEYIQENGHEILGSRAMKFDHFPILIKLIDARDNLSIQVHPSDAYALEHEGEYGKTEMWYILGCEEGASLYYGLKTEVTQQELRQRIEDNTLLCVLNRVPVHKGDVFFIEAGTIHAIGKGITICEIQQNSNTTYRVYDYDRRDKNGCPRPLHIEQAIAVSSLRPAPKTGYIPAAPQTKQQRLATCKYFTVDRLNVCGAITQTIDAGCFRSLIITDGTGVLSMNGDTLSFQKGDSIFIPAQDGAFTLEGQCEVIISQV